MLKTQIIAVVSSRTFRFTADRLPWCRMELLCWFGAVVLFAVGLIGTVLPIVPGTVIILAAAVLHRAVLGAGKSIGWRALTVLVVLTLVSLAIDFLASYIGAKRFGATRWGTLGAIVGAIAGLFFGLPGIFIGPLVGVFAGELIGGKRLIDAGRAGWGSLLGNLAGILSKLLIAITMILIFLGSAPSPI